MNASETRADALLAAVLNGYQKEGDALTDDWKVLEVKAQATVATAGIFIGALLALAKDSIEGQVAMLGAAVTVSALGLAVAFAVVALLVRHVVGAPSGLAIETMADDLLGLKPGADWPARLENFQRDRIRLWREYSSGRVVANEDKARWLLRAQWMLLVGVTLATVLALTSLVTREPAERTRIHVEV